jgi:hypothetical protein
MNQATSRLTTHAVAIIIKEAVKTGCIAGGMSEAKAEERARYFSGHSLRAGFATSAAAYGVTGENIARQTRHKSTQMVQRYVREAELSAKNPLKQMGGACPPWSPVSLGDFIEPDPGAAAFNGKLEQSPAALSRRYLSETAPLPLPYSSNSVVGSALPSFRTVCSACFYAGRRSTHQHHSE